MYAPFDDLTQQQLGPAVFQTAEEAAAEAERLGAAHPVGVEIRPARQPSAKEAADASARADWGAVARALWMAADAARRQRDWRLMREAREKARFAEQWSGAGGSLMAAIFNDGRVPAIGSDLQPALKAGRQITVAAAEAARRAVEDEVASFARRREDARRAEYEARQAARAAAEKRRAAEAAAARAAEIKAAEEYAARHFQIGGTIEVPPSSYACDPVPGHAGWMFQPADDTHRTIAAVREGGRLKIAEVSPRSKIILLAPAS